jgi:hypothetical protein
LIIEETRKTIAQLWRGSKPKFSPSKLKQSLANRHNDFIREDVQNDCEELLRHWLNDLID